MNALSLLGSTLGLGFASGLNIYAAVLVVGLGVRFGFIHFFKHRLNHGQEVLQILQKAKNEQAAAGFRLAAAVL